MADEGDCNPGGLRLARSPQVNNPLCQWMGLFTYDWAPHSTHNHLPWVQELWRHGCHWAGWGSSVLFTAIVYAIAMWIPHCASSGMRTTLWPKPETFFFFFAVTELSWTIELLLSGKPVLNKIALNGLHWSPNSKLFHGMLVDIGKILLY